MALAAIPQNMYVQTGNGTAFISWDLSVGATEYSIQVSTDGINYSVLTSVAANSYNDTSVTLGLQYWYKVASVNGSGTSPYTSPQSVVPVNSGTMSLGQIRLLSQQRADRVNSNFVTTPEWNSYINQSAFELYDLLVTLYEDYYLAPAAMITTDGVSTQYPLPTDFYKLMGVDCGLSGSGNAWVTLKKFDFIARNRYVYPQITSTFLGVFNMQYRVLGSNVELIPTPSAGQYLRLWYIPRMKQLVADTDILDSISGWSEYIITDAAIKALQKEESDVSVLMAQKMALKQRIEETAMNRDAGQPDTISNTRSWNERWGGNGFDGSFGGY